MSYKQVVLGLLSYFPAVAQRLLIKPSGGTDSARYCYSVWLRHISMAHTAGLFSAYPKVVAELGPGNSIGIGLAALISGVETYHGFDAIPYAGNLQRNLEVFDELVELFKQRSAIPGPEELPRVKPFLDNYDFPQQLLTEKHLATALNEERLQTLRKDLIQLHDSKAQHIHYTAPWDHFTAMQRHSVDMVFSQAVLEHVEDLPGTYEAIYAWLKPTGFMSHQIDFKCHGTAKEWNGHLKYSKLHWKLIKGRRPFLLNRKVYSDHVRCLNPMFNVVYEKKVQTTSGVQRQQLSKQFKNVQDSDLQTSGAFMLSNVKAKEAV